VIAINAQIDPSTAGGTETNLISLLRKVGESPRAERYVALGIPKHLPALRRLIGRRQQVVSWPFREVGHVRARDGRWAALHRRAGGGWRAAAVAWAYRRYLRSLGLPRHPPSAWQSDLLLTGDRISLVHFPYAVRFETTLPFVYEPWDLQHRHFPAFFSGQELAWRENAYLEGCRRARLVITATRWVKQDIAAQYGMNDAKIAVVPRGSLLSTAPPPPARRERFWREHEIPEGYAYYPAMTFAHKNHVRLLHALSRLRRDHGIVLPLVCTGRFYRAHWPTVEAEVERLGLTQQVRFLGPVPDDMMSALYRHARFLVFPSLFEGLGLPLLEAMQHDLPILASASACIPEVAVTVATLFDGTSVEAMTRTIREAVMNPGFGEGLGPERRKVVARFSWDEAIATLTACYRAAAGWPLSEEQQYRLTLATRT
jgi:glycosyltransferase involved in cell wall biosynthesis